MSPRPALLALLSLLAAGAAAASNAPADARLIDQYAAPVEQRDLAGHWLLVYFGYSACREICPAAVSKMSAVAEALKSEQGGILALFITVDPTADSPARLREFAAHFSPRLRALTGSPEAIAEAARTFGVPVKARAGGADFDHGVLMYLVAPGGRVVRMFHPQQSVAEITAGVRACRGGADGRAATNRTAAARGARAS